MRGLYWEQWEVGAEFESPARNVTEADIVAFAGPTKPVRPGDTLRARIKVLDKRGTSNLERGVMRRQLQVLNQRDEVVQEGVQAFLLKRRPA